MSKRKLLKVQNIWQRMSKFKLNITRKPFYLPSNIVLSSKTGSFMDLAHASSFHKTSFNILTHLFDTSCTKIIPRWMQFSHIFFHLVFKDVKVFNYPKLNSISIFKNIENKILRIIKVCYGICFELSKYYTVCWYLFTNLKISLWKVF